MLDITVFFVHFYLEFHDVTASRCADKPCSYTALVLVERAYVARVFIMVDHVLVIGKGTVVVVAHSHDWRMKFEGRLFDDSSGEWSVAPRAQIDKQFSVLHFF